MEEEKSLSQEDNMRSESESDKSDDQNKEDDSGNNEKISDEEEIITEEDEDYEEPPKGGLFPKYGCLRGCLIPIFAIFVIISAIGIVIHSKRGVIHEWLILRIVSNTQEKVLTQPPDGIDKKAIDLTFDNVRSAIKNDKIDEQEMETAIKEYLETTKDLTSPDRKKAEIDKLILRLNKAISDSS